MLRRTAFGCAVAVLVAWAVMTGCDTRENGLFRSMLQSWSNLTGSSAQKLPPDTREAPPYDPFDMTTWTREQRRSTMQAQYQAALLARNSSVVETSQVKLQLAYVLDRQRKFAEAAQLYSEFIAEQKKRQAVGAAFLPTASAIHNLALDFDRMGDTEAALATLDEGIAGLSSMTSASQANRDAALLYYARSNFLLQDGRLKLAERDLASARSADPSSGVIASNLAAVRSDLGVSAVALQPLVDAAAAQSPSERSHAEAAAINSIAAIIEVSGQNETVRDQLFEKLLQSTSFTSSARHLGIVRAMLTLERGRNFRAHDALESSLVRELRLNGPEKGDLTFHRAMSSGCMCDRDFVNLLRNHTAVTAAVFDEIQKTKLQRALVTTDALTFWQPRFTRRFGFSMLRVQAPPNFSKIWTLHSERSDGTFGKGVISERLVRELLGGELERAGRAFLDHCFVTLVLRPTAVVSKLESQTGTALARQNLQSWSRQPPEIPRGGMLDPAATDLLQLKLVVAITSVDPIRAWVHPRVCTQFGRGLTFNFTAHEEGSDARCSMELHDAIRVLRQNFGRLVPSARSIATQAREQARQLILAGHSAWKESKAPLTAAGISRNETLARWVCPFQLLAVDLRLLSNHQLVSVDIFDRYRFEDSFQCATPCLGGREFSKELIDITGANGQHFGWHRQVWSLFAGTIAPPQSKPLDNKSLKNTHGWLDKLLREYTHRGRFELLIPANATGKSMFHRVSDTERSRFSLHKPERAACPMQRRANEQKVFFQSIENVLRQRAEAAAAA